MQMLIIIISIVNWRPESETISYLYLNVKLEKPIKPLPYPE